jgi:hypothetical protein
MANCVVRLLQDPHTSALIMLVAVVVTTALQFKYTMMTLAQVQEVVDRIAEDGIPDAASASRRLDSSAAYQDSYKEAYDKVYRDAPTSSPSVMPTPSPSERNDVAVVAEAQRRPSNQSQHEERSPSGTKMPAWKTDRRIDSIIAFFYLKSYVAVFFTVASVFFLVAHDLTQYVGFLRSGPGSRRVHQAAGCLCGRRCGLHLEERVEAWKTAVGHFHSFWNTAIGVFTFLLVHLVCQGGAMCLVTSSVAAMAVATGLLKSIENILHEVKVGLKTISADVRHAARKVDGHPNYVVRASVDSSQNAQKMVSFLSAKNQRYASVAVLFATAENGFSAAFVE